MDPSITEGLRLKHQQETRDPRGHEDESGLDRDRQRQDPELRQRSISPADAMQRHLRYRNQQSAAATVALF